MSLTMSQVADSTQKSPPPSTPRTRLRKFTENEETMVRDLYLALHYPYTLVLAHWAYLYAVTCFF